MHCVREIITVNQNLTVVTKLALVPPHLPTDAVKLERIKTDAVTTEEASGPSRRNRKTEENNDGIQCGIHVFGDGW